MTEREMLLEQVAALALGILPPAEADKLRYQIGLDDELYAEYQALRSTADLVGYAAEREPLDELSSARIKSKLMKAVRADVATPQQRQLARAGFVWPAYAVAAVAAVAAVLSFANNVSLRSDLTAEQHRAADLQQQVAAQTSAAHEATSQLADLFAPDSKHYAVKGGEVITHGGHVYIALRSLPALPAGKVFQAWTLAKGAKAVAPSITFVPSGAGSAIVRLPVDAGGLAAVAVSVEPKGGSKAPTSTPTFIRPLS